MDRVALFKLILLWATAYARGQLVAQVVGEASFNNTNFASGNPTSIYTSVVLQQLLPFSACSFECGVVFDFQIAGDNLFTAR